MRRSICLLLVLLILTQPFLAAVRGNKAMYVGGTVKGIPEKTMGTFDVSGETLAVFRSGKGETLAEIPFNKITSLEYGQKAGRRVGVAIAVTWLALFSKKRKHFLTIGFTDQQSQKQGVVLELAKGTVRPTLTVLETKTGQKVEYESKEAKEHVD